MKLSIIIPAYNEATRMPPTLEAYTAAFAGEDYEILIVVNHSSDGTAELAQAWSESHSEVRYIVFPDPLGKGGAVHEGFEEARGDLVGFVDADGATPPEAFRELVDALGARPGLGGVIASRWLAASNVLTPQPLKRRIASRMFNLAVRSLFHLHYRDTQCGAKLFRATAIREVLGGLESKGWLFDVELLLRIRQNGHAIEEVPTTWRDVAGSRFSMGASLLPVLKDLRALRRRAGTTARSR